MAISETAGCVDQPAIDRRVADPAAHGAEEIEALARGEAARGECADARSAGRLRIGNVGALEIGFEAPHPCSKLPVVSQLRAANDAVRRQLKSRRRRTGNEGRIPKHPGRGIAGGPQLRVIRGAPPVPEVQSAVRPGPVIRGRDGRRLVHRRRKIGGIRAGRRNACNERGAREKKLLHGVVPFGFS